MLPYLGWAHETHQTAPSCLRGGVSEGGRGGKEGEGMYPLRVSVSRWESPSTSKILTVRSEEQVARRRP